MEVVLLRWLLVIMSSMVERQRVAAIEYLIAENRVLRGQLGEHRLKLSYAQRRRLGLKGRALGRAALGQFATLASPDTILGWYRSLVARKYDGSKKRRGGRPRTKLELESLVVRMAEVEGANRQSIALRVGCSLAQVRHPDERSGPQGTHF